MLACMHDSNEIPTTIYTYVIEVRHHNQGCARDLPARDRDRDRDADNASETETSYRSRRDRDRDRDLRGRSRDFYMDL